MVSAPASERTASPEPRWETLPQSPPPTGFGAMSVDRRASGSVRPKVHSCSCAEDVNNCGRHKQVLLAL